MPVSIEELTPDAFYWARRRGTIQDEIVQISTAFGIAPEFLTVAVIGTDQHFDLEAFEFHSVINRTAETND